MITNISPVILFVKDFQKALVFYRDTLGLTPSSSEATHGEFASFAVGSVGFSIHGGYKGGKGGPIDIHFLTKDIWEEVKRLKEKGVSFTKDVEMMPWGSYQATFLDSDGNELELYQE